FSQRPRVHSAFVVNPDPEAIEDLFRPDIHQRIPYRNAGPGTVGLAGSMRKNLTNPRVAYLEQTPLSGLLSGLPAPAVKLFLVNRAALLQARNILPGPKQPVAILGAMLLFLRWLGRVLRRFAPRPEDEAQEMNEEIGIIAQQSAQRDRRGRV